MSVYPGRWHATIEGDFVVFLVGARINKPLRVRQWWPVVTAMPPMVRELEQRPDLGMLKACSGFMFGGPALVQYWRSFEALEAYAREAERLHLPAWKRFNRAVRDSGEVGIWHETYKVRGGEYETIYGNMPRVGLGAAGDHAAIGTSARSAAVRIGARPDDAPPVEAY